MQMIANDAGIAVGTIYNYFKGKKDILDNIFLMEYENFTKCMDNIEKRNTSVPEKLNQFLECQFEHFFNEPDTLKVIVKDILPQQKGNDSVELLFNKMIDRLAALITEGQERNEIGNINPKLFAYAILNVVMVIVYMYFSNDTLFGYGEAREQIIGLFMNFAKR